MEKNEDFGMTEAQYEELNDKTHASFATHRQTRVGPSPFMRTKVLALTEERFRASQSRGRALWRRWLPSISLATVAAAACVIAWVQFNSRKLDIGLDQKMVLRIKDEGNRFKNVAAVQVELPPGLEFYAEGHPELAQQAVVTLPWSHDGADSALPVVLSAREIGTKTVKIRYLDSDEREVVTKNLKIQVNRQNVAGEQRI